jgi:hypothetical protein
MMQEPQSEPIYTSSYEYTKPKAPKKQPDGQSGMWLTGIKWLKNLVAAFGIGVVLLSALAYLFSDEITQSVVKAIASELKTELKIQEVDLSFLKSFPKGAVVLHKVHLDDVLGEPLLIAEEVILQFNLLTLLDDDIVLDGIFLKKGALNILTDQKGKQNFDIFKPSGNKSGNNSKLDIRNARLVDMVVSIKDLGTPFHLQSQIHEATFAGRFASAQFALSSVCEMTVQKLQIKKQNYLNQTEASFETSMTIDLRRRAFQIKKGILNIGDSNTLSVLGMAVLGPKHQDFDLAINAQKGDISLLMQLLPFEALKGLKSTGNYYCKGTIKGRLSDTSYPDVKLNFGMTNGNIAHTLLPTPLKQVHFNSYLAINRNRKGSFDMTDFKAMHQGSPISLSLRLTDFNDPYIDLKANGKLNFQAEKQDQSVLRKGNFDISQLYIQGAVRNMSAKHLSDQVRISGKMSCSDIVFYHNGQPIKIAQGHLVLNQGKASLTDVKLNIGGTDLELNTEISPALSLVFQHGSKQNPVHYQAKIQTKSCDLAALWAVFNSSSTKEKQNSAQQPTGAFSWLDGMQGKVDIQINQMNHEKLLAQNTVGQIQFKNQDFIFKAHGNAMQGKIAIAGKLSLAEKIKVELNTSVREIDLTTCFAQMNSFGQDLITDKNIRGNLTGNIAATAFWKANGTFLDDQLHVYADLLAHDGALNHVKTFEDFSKYIHITDLQNVHFTTLQNYIEVRNRVVSIPVMSIKNNACPMIISGTHSFDQMLNYGIKLDAGQVLLKRILNRSNKAEAAEGLVNLNYTIKGHIDAYKMERNQKAVKQIFEQSKEHKTAIASALDAAFKRYTPEFQHFSPLREIFPDDQLIAQSDIAPRPNQTSGLAAEPDQIKNEPDPKHQSKSRKVKLQKALAPTPAKVIEADENEFLDEIVGGNK